MQALKPATAIVEQSAAASAISRLGLMVEVGCRID